MNIFRKLPYDFTFYVGKEHFPMRAHRFVLENYPYWSGLFAWNPAVKAQIVEECCPRTFNLFLQSLYGQELNSLKISRERLEELAYLADYFCIKFLSERIQLLGKEQVIAKIRALTSSHELHRPLRAVLEGLEPQRECVQPKCSPMEAFLTALNKIGSRRTTLDVTRRNELPQKVVVLYGMPRSFILVTKECKYLCTVGCPDA